MGTKTKSRSSKTHQQFGTNTWSALKHEEGFVADMGQHEIPARPSRFAILQEDSDEVTTSKHKDQIDLIMSKDYRKSISTPMGPKRVKKPNKEPSLKPEPKRVYSIDDLQRSNLESGFVSKNRLQTKRRGEVNYPNRGRKFFENARPHIEAIRKCRNYRRNPDLFARRKRILNRILVRMKNDALYMEFIKCSLKGHLFEFTKRMPKTLAKYVAGIKGGLFQIECKVNNFVAKKLIHRAKYCTSTLTSLSDLSEMSQYRLSV